MAGSQAAIGRAWRSTTRLAEIMNAKCSFTSLSKISDSSLLEHVREHVHQDDIGLTKGQRYPVQGVIFRAGIAWYYLCDEPDADYPKPYCSLFFELDEKAVPGNWVLVPEIPAILVPSAWARFPLFLEKLVNGDEQALAVFASIKRSLPPNSP